MSIEFIYKEFKPSPWNLLSTGRGVMLHVIGCAQTPYNLVMEGADHGFAQTYKDFPAIREVHDWCLDTFGADTYTWKSYYVIGTQRYGDAVGKRDVFAQYYFHTRADMALFKLRWKI